MFQLIGEKVTRAANVHAALVADLRAQLRLVEGEESDAFLTALIDRAAAIVERNTRRILTPATVECMFAGDGDEVTLEFSPVNSITGVVDGDVAVSFTAPAVGYAWHPVVKFDHRESDALKVTCSAGYEPGFVPPEMVVLVLTLAADLYEHPQVQENQTITENKVFAALMASATPIGVK